MPDSIRPREEVDVSSPRGRVSGFSPPSKAPHSGALQTGPAGGGFTLIELLVTIGILAVLGALAASVYSAAIEKAHGARCAQNLRQLGVVTSLYLGDHNNTFFPYAEFTEDGRMWYFGLETGEGGRSEGERDLDRAAGPLYPYIGMVGGIEICTGFNYRNVLYKPKFKGASWGYGYNWWLGGMFRGTPLQRLHQLANPARVIVFGDCAQVNTFQSPASGSNPMLEEFYIIDERSATIHFRHSGRANVLFADGHAEALRPHPGTIDMKLPAERVGRISAAGSTEFLR